MLLKLFRNLFVVGTLISLTGCGGDDKKVVLPTGESKPPTLSGSNNKQPGQNDGGMAKPDVPAPPPIEPLK